MALKATIYKAKISVANLNIHHYQEYNLTLARHPSETNLRMMYRLLVFSLNCKEEGLDFTKGLSSDEEPDLWKINYDGSIEHWIELGHLDEKRIRQACSKANLVSIFTYQDANSINWYNSVENSIQRFNHLNITHFSMNDNHLIEDLVERGMNFTIVIEDEDIWISTENNRINVTFKSVYKAKN